MATEQASKIAIAIIAKDKEDVIERMLDSTKSVFDFYTLQDTGSADKTIEKFESWCKKNNKQYAYQLGNLANTPKEIEAIRKEHPEETYRIYKYVLVDGKKVLAQFNEARNDSFSLIPSDVEYAFWIDTDDILVGAEQIPQIVSFAKQNNVDMVMMEYIYAKSPDGIKPVTQRRERLLSLKKKGKWANWVHENYRFDEPVTMLRDEDLRKLGFTIRVDHLRTANEALATNRRNNLIMQMQLQQEGLDNFPDEMLSHLAYDHWEHREYDQSIKYYELLIDRYVDKPVHVEALFVVYMKLSTAYQGLGKRDKSMQYAFRAVEAMPAFAEGYLQLARLFAEVNNWDEVHHYADKVMQLGIPETTSPINEYDYYVAPLELKMRAFLSKGLIREAIEVCKKLRSIIPNNPQVQGQLHNLLALQKENNALRAIGELSLYYQENNQSDTLDRVLAAIPLKLKDNDVMRNKIKEMKHDFKRKSVKHVWPANYKKTIVIYAGGHFEPWDGDSDITKGIGGSEGMCIQLSRELAALGNKVIVYNECGESDSKLFDGVTYLHHSKWNPDLKADVFISLRRPDVFNQLIKATKQYLWLHDTGYGDVPLVDFYSANKVIVLSDFHKDIIKLNHGVTDDKIFWNTRNGLNAKALEYADQHAGKRNPLKLIWASSYDRGLDNALDIFAKVVREIPETEFEICYGWPTFDGLMEGRTRSNPQWGEQLKRFKSEIVEKIAKTPNVRELGRIPQNELYKKFKEAGIWFYPTEFQEISCITAMQAQALGTIPVCTPFAALNETVSSKYGVKASLNQIGDALIHVLRESKEGKLEKKREEMMKWARNRYDMKKLAEEWNEFFNQD